MEINLDLESLSIIAKFVFYAIMDEGICLFLLFLAEIVILDLNGFIFGLLQVLLNDGAIADWGTVIFEKFV